MCDAHDCLLIFFPVVCFLRVHFFFFCCFCGSALSFLFSSQQSRCFYHYCYIFPTILGLVYSHCKFSWCRRQSPFGYSYQAGHPRHCNLARSSFVVAVHFFSFVSARRRLYHLWVLHYFPGAVFSWKSFYELLLWLMSSVDIIMSKKPSCLVDQSCHYKRYHLCSLSLSLFSLSIVRPVAVAFSALEIPVLSHSRFVPRSCLN